MLFAGARNQRGGFGHRPHLRDHHQRRYRQEQQTAVLSESTRRTDLGEKRDAYLSIPSLKVLLLAESDRPYVLVCRRQPEGGFAAEAHSGLAAVIDLPEIGAALPLADLYEGISFPAPRGDS